MRSETKKEPTETKRCGITAGQEGLPQACATVENLRIFPKYLTVQETQIALFTFISYAHS